MPPILEDFGLNADAMACLPKLSFGAGNVEKRIPIGAALFVVALLLIVRPSLLMVLPVAMGGWIGGLTFLFAVNSLLGRLEKMLLYRRNRNFRNACAYNAARAVYLTKKWEFDLWSTKRREEYWRSLSGTAFETELGNLFSRMGYNVSLTPRTGDGGVDLCLRKEGKLTVVQCKAHNKRIPIGVARELSASMADFHADDAIIACFEGVTQPVADYIKNKPISVLKLSEILDLQKRLG